MNYAGDDLLERGHVSGAIAAGLVGRSSPPCGSEADGNYNLPLHVFALFVVLVQSILSCSFPLIVKRFPQLRVPHHFLFLSRHFGTGVLIATAFVHLLPTAFTSLTDPCLPAFWNDGYPAMAGLIAMVSVFLVVVIEMVFSSMNGGAMGGCHGGAGAAYDPLGAVTPTFANHTHARSASLASNSTGSRSVFRPGHRRSASIGSQLRRMNQHEAMPEPRLDSLITTNQHQYFKSEEEEADDDDATSTTSEDGVDSSELRTLNGSGRKTPHSAGMRRSGSMGLLTEEQQQKKNLLQVMLLEAGILFHSVFIGMALSVATGSNFIVLFIAIVFHQTFEGLALGSRIASITAFGNRSWKPWAMCMAYGTTTPIGQAIGLATRKLYDPQSQTGLLMVGIMNAISSGLLLFAGLVELLAEDFLSDESYMVLYGRRRMEASLAVGLGAMGMALIGAWA